MKKNTLHWFQIFIGFLFLILLTGNGYPRDKKIEIFTSIMPQKYFADRIAGDRINVNVLVLPGKSPASYSPIPAQIAKLSLSLVYFKIGVPFEKFLMPRIKSIAKDILIVDTSRGIKFRKMKHGHDHHASISANDPHTWLSPVLAKKQVEIIYKTLLSIDPGGRDIYYSGFKSLVKEIDRIHNKIKKVLKPLEGSSLFVFHPAFGYFADLYGLKQRAIEIEGKSPKARDLALFIKRAKKENARVIFVQPQFDQNAAKKIANAIKGSVITINPLAYDYIKNLEKIAEKIRKGIK